MCLAVGSVGDSISGMPCRGVPGGHMVQSSTELQLPLATCPPTIAAASVKASSVWCSHLPLWLDSSEMVRSVPGGCQGVATLGGGKLVSGAASVDSARTEPQLGPPLGGLGRRMWTDALIWTCKYFLTLSETIHFFLQFIDSVTCGHPCYDRVIQLGYSDG